LGKFIKPNLQRLDCVLLNIIILLVLFVGCVEVPFTNIMEFIMDYTQLLNYALSSDIVLAFSGCEDSIESNGKTKKPKTLEGGIIELGVSISLPYKKNHYVWKVKTYNYGNSSFSDQQSFSLIDPKIPIVSRVVFENRHPIVEWNDVAGASSYEVYRSVNNKSNYYHVTTTNASQWVDSDYLQPDFRASLTIYYKVKSVVNNNDSDFSNEMGIGVSDEIIANEEN